MKKVMMVVGVAACVTLVGCKHDEYGAHKVGNKVQPVETVEVAPDVDPLNVGAEQSATTSSAAVAPAKGVETTGTPSTMAVPANDEGQATTTVTAVPDEPVKPAPAKPAPAKAAAPAKAGGETAAKPEAEFTPYVVRGGDTLGGICHRYKVKKADVLALNPGMDPNKIFVGRTIKLPGKIEALAAAQAAKADAAPAAKKPAAAAAPAAKREYKPYTGPTKVHVVAAGETIGHLAYSNGLSIRQFKELNGLKNDVIRIGQKVKIPVEKVKSDKPVAVPSVKKEAAKPGPKVIEEKKDEIKPVEEKPAEDKPKDTVVEANAAAAAPAAAAPAEAAPAAAVPVAAAVPADDGKYTTYTVKANDDLYSVAIKWSITASQLKEINNLVDDTLTPGQVLKVPATVE